MHLLFLSFYIYLKNKKWCITWCICLLGLFIRYPNRGASDMLKGIGMVLQLVFIFHFYFTLLPVPPVEERQHRRFEVQDGRGRP